MRTYVGVRRPNGTARVYVEEPNANGTIDRRELTYRRGRGSHSPTGFEWGYGGSGPAELARAIVKDVTSDPNPEPRVYQRFKFMAVALLPHDRWSLTDLEIREVLNLIEREHAAAVGAND